MRWRGGTLLSEDMGSSSVGTIREAAGQALGFWFWREASGSACIVEGQLHRQNQSWPDAHTFPYAKARRRRANPTGDIPSRINRHTGELPSVFPRHAQAFLANLVDQKASGWMVGGMRADSSRYPKFLFPLAGFLWVMIERDTRN